MTRSMWKYNLKVTDEQTIEIPRGAYIRSVGLDGEGKLSLWAEVDAELKNVKDKRQITICGTGNPIPGNAGIFIGTVTLLDSGFVAHIYVKPG